MQAVLSYNGGVSRGEMLARKLFSDGKLVAFFQPNISHATKIKVKKTHLKTSKIFCYLRNLYFLKNYLTQKKPTKRFWIDRANDWDVARRFPKKGNVFVGQAGISYNCLKKARSLGYRTLLDRTNSHILHQNKIWGELNRQNGLNWMPSSARVTKIHLAEYEVADFILVLSSFAKNTFLDAGISSAKVILCPSGVDENEFVPRFLDKKKKIMLLCGSISHKKGCHTILEAARQIQEPNVEFWFLGEVSPEMNTLMKNKPRNCFHIPFQRRDLLPGLYNQASAFLLPSYEEGLPKVILEAMACGLPVVTTAEAAGEDLVNEGESGFLVKPGDINCLVARVRQLLQNPDAAQKMGINGRKIIENKFTEQLYYQRFSGILDGLIPL